MLEIIRVSPQTIAGFGEPIYKVEDEFGEVVCYLGKSSNQEKIYFAGAVTAQQVVAVAELLKEKRSNLLTKV